MANFKFYAVKEGRETGVFANWTKCADVTQGYSGAKYKGFDDREAAEAWINGGDPPSKRNGHDCTEVYVDGSHQPGAFGWAFVVVEDGEIVFEYSENTCVENLPEDLASQNNIAAEMKGAMAAAAWAEQNDEEIIIRHDCEGLEKWATHEWDRNNDFTEAYAKYMRQKGRDGFVKGFEWVKGHSGNRGNERADTLAYEAAGKLVGPESKTKGNKVFA